MPAIHSINVTHGVQTRMGELPSAADLAVTSLEQRLIQGFAQLSVDVHRDHAALNAMLARPDITHPEVLAQLQVRMADYNLDVNMLNTLVRKSVATAETLLRSS